MNGFKFRNDHDDFNEKIRPQLFEISNILIVNFSSVKIRRIEKLHGFFFNKLNDENPTVLLF